jgi:putative hemolysin
MKKLPHEGESFTDQGWSFEIIDMDNRRIDKIIVTKTNDQSDETRG